MYIPIWIIVIVAAVGFWYVLQRLKRVENHVGVSKSTEQEIDARNDLTPDQKEMLKHISAYRQRTGKEMPTYKEMLALSKEEHQSWLIFRALKDNREKLLAEMIEHEEKTGSFGKTARGNDPPHTKLVLDVFKKDRSEEVTDVLQRLSDTANELGYEKDGGKGDIIRDAIYAKAASDYVGLGEKMEKDRHAEK